MSRDKFLIELHAHTAEVSRCGQMPAREVIRRAKAAGYSCVVITDHLYAGFEPGRPMDVRAARYLRGYRAARAAGERRGVHVLLGIEARIDRYGPEDFLIYGPREEDIPTLFGWMDRMTEPEQLSRAVRENGWLLIQAHPFRTGLRAVAVELLDGVEVYSGNPRHNNHNGLALHHAQSRDGMIMTSGSDIHQPEDVGRGGIRSTVAIATMEELIAYLREKRVPERIET